ncbi:hypothetical protein JW823_03865 [bacterium]|nr:hypothetical protein [candidate division CSSED10-310 bacterium]
MKGKWFATVIRILTGCSLGFWFWGCATNPAYRTGLTALEQGHFEVAVAALEQASLDNPDSIEVAIALDRARHSAAESMITEAQRNLDDENFDEAFINLEKAIGYSPKQPGIEDAFELLDRKKQSAAAYEEGRQLEEYGHPDDAMRCFRNALRLNPDHRPAASALEALESKASVSDNKQENMQISFEIRDMSLGDVFDALATVAKRNILIDETVDRSRSLTLALEDIDVNQAMEDIAASCGLILIRLNHSTYILSTDSPESRDRYIREDVRVFPLKYADADRVKELLEPIVDEAVILADRRTNSVVVRTRSERMDLVSDLVDTLDIRESEVVVEVEILEVSKGKMADIGMDLGDDPMITATLGGGIKSAGSGGRITVSELDDLSGGQIFLTVPSLYVKLLKNDSQTRVLAQPRLRILNRTPARLHIGEQVPIKVTSSMFRNTSEEMASYSYRDVGILINMTPRILSDSELALDLKLVVSSIIKASEEGHPTIGTREVETTLRLRHGEVEIIAGLIREDERSGKVSIPLLGDIPVLGRLFTSQSQNSSQTDIVISLTPHILDRRISAPEQHWTGLLKRSGKAMSAGSETKRDGQDYKDRIVLEPHKSLDGGSIVDSTASVTPARTDENPGEGLATVSIDPQYSALITGDSGDVQIVIADAENVGSVPFYIDYDPTVLEIVEVREGPFMGNDGVSTAFLSSIDDRRGRIIIGLSRLGAQPGLSGSGVLVYITAKGIKPGQSPLAFSHESVLDPMARALPAQFLDGSISVSTGN